MISTATDTNRITYNQGIASPGSMPLSENEARKAVTDNHKGNIQIIEDSLKDNSTGNGENITIRVPADKDGKQIINPSEQDWINAAKNGSFVETTGKPADFARLYYNTILVDFGDAALNAKVNSDLIAEVRIAVNNGCVSINPADINPSIEGNTARAIIAYQQAVSVISDNTGTYGQLGVLPADKVTLKVPADASGKPLKNPTIQDWINAEKNNRYTEVTGSPFELSKDHLGVELNSSWRLAYSENHNALRAACNAANKEAGKLMEFNKDIDAGNRMAKTALDDIDPNIIPEAMALMGKSYGDAMNAAKTESDRMDSLRKKYDALQKLENSLSTNSAGGANVTISVPTKRYVVDSEGNRVKDANGQFKTQAVGTPPSNDDWANAVPDSFQDKTGTGRDIADKYFDIKLSNVSGDNSSNINLSNNLTKISNARSLVDAEMKKISGKFDFDMGNVQTIMSLINKVMSQMNDTALSISRGI